MKIRVSSLKLKETISIGETVDFPRGMNAYVLMIFKSSGLIKSELGLTDCSDGDCILLDPSFPVFIKPKNNKLLYDSISFKGSDAARLIQQIGIDLNVIASPLQTYFIDSVIDKIAKEIHSKDLLWERVVVNSLDELLSKIQRFSKQDFVLSMPDHSQNLRDLRSEVHESFSKPWTIGKMANIMGLSASRFASLYKKEFRTSPTEDLIRTRIDQAKKMLSATKVSVKKVSVACGFESVHYFHRAFKKRNKITPKHFQNKQLSLKGSVPTADKTFTLDGLSTNSDFIGTISVEDGEVFLNPSNSKWMKFLGYDPATRTKPLLNFIAPTHLEVGQETINNIVEGKNIKEVSLDLINANGEIVGIEFSALVKGDAWFWFARSLDVLVT